MGELRRDYNQVDKVWMKEWYCKKLMRIMKHVSKTWVAIPLASCNK